MSSPVDSIYLFCPDGAAALYLMRGPSFHCNESRFCNQEELRDDMLSLPTVILDISKWTHETRL